MDVMAQCPYWPDSSRCSSGGSESRECPGDAQPDSAHGESSGHTHTGDASAPTPTTTHTDWSAALLTAAEQVCGMSGVSEPARHALMHWARVATDDLRRASPDQSTTST